ncbi:iron sulfur assembly protein 1, putative [Acanthamoeba castellanii str. Neff]|uniref:Iron sulfur assembly protein 1, putative n=1 Tax=Acanthamoeba castellanii (strain ATCC 30010 / Neff) TaxID=1257118 RepID=L8HA83_ACACF|nr:iron sulfur assembly protein 1, putative [Acanthamoeba castellanii str. Neff]ELR22085.1 iron sulfur assembly protein 1, putative [Acanthamoeba castellanii str. Neff]
MSVAGTVRVVRKPLTSRFAAKAPITLTPAAVSRLHSLMGGSKDKYEGIRLDVKSRGCGGNSFTLDYAEKKERTDEVVEADGVKVFVGSKALLHVIGTEMDYVEDDLQSGFVFNNPQAKSTCGCGESFTL